MKAKSFPRQARVINSLDYKRVIEVSCRYSLGKVLMARVAVGFGPQARLGIALSRRHLVSAVARNAIKRLLREQFRCFFLKLYPVDIVFLSYKKLNNLAFQKENLKTALPEFFSLFIKTEDL